MKVRTGVKAGLIQAGGSWAAGMDFVKVEVIRADNKTEVQTGVGGNGTARTVVVPEEEVGGADKTCSDWGRSGSDR